MFECEKCIHEAVCDRSSRQMWATMGGETECSDFEDKAKYVDTMLKWISVKDRLPKHCSDLLIMVDGRVSLGFYNTRFRHWINYVGINNDVTHWMPLPEPPKEE